MSNISERYMQVVGTFFLFLGLCAACLALVPEYFGDKYGLWTIILPVGVASFLTFRVLRHHSGVTQDAKR